VAQQYIDLKEKELRTSILCLAKKAGVTRYFAGLVVRELNDGLLFLPNDYPRQQELGIRSKKIAATVLGDKNDYMNYGDDANAVAAAAAVETNSNNNSEIWEDNSYMNYDDIRLQQQHDQKLLNQEQQQQQQPSQAEELTAVFDPSNEEPDFSVEYQTTCKDAVNHVTRPQCRPSPPLPTTLASGKHVPTRCFNPFNESAPCGFWESTKKELEVCAAKLLGYESTHQFLFIYYLDIVKNISMDDVLEKGGYVGYVVHSKRDVLLCGLTPNAAKQAFIKIATLRNATKVVEEAFRMMPLIRKRAGLQKGTFKTIDNYTMRFGYSMNQLRPCPAKKKNY
jgi:hypothetical protein